MSTGNDTANGVNTDMGRPASSDLYDAAQTTGHITGVSCLSKRKRKRIEDTEDEETPKKAIMPPPKRHCRSNEMQEAVKPRCNMDIKERTKSIKENDVDAMVIDDEDELDSKL